MSLPNVINPFEVAVDARVYVSRPASDDALGQLERLVSEVAPAVVLRGPAGIGKSMLLAVLDERFAGSWRVARIAVSPSPSMEISHRVLDQLEVEREDEGDPSAALALAARNAAARGRRVLVIVDQATHAPVASSRQLVRAATRARGDLCVVFAVTEDEADAASFEREIGAEAAVVTVRFDTPMDAEETAEYIRRHLGESSDAAALEDKFDESAMRYVTEGARGNPRRVNALAYETLRRLAAGEPIPDRYDGAADPGASPARPRTQPFEDVWNAQGSLGGGLLGGDARRSAEASDPMHELFPPGFLKTGIGPLVPPDETATDEGAQGRDQSAPDTQRPASTDVDRTSAPPPASSLTSAASTWPLSPAPQVGASSPPATARTSAPSTEASPPTGLADPPASPRVADAASATTTTTTGERGEAASVAAAPEPSRPIGAAKRQWILMAAVVVAAVMGGYMAGRVDRDPAAPTLATAEAAVDEAASASPEPVEIEAEGSASLPLLSHDLPTRRMILAPDRPLAALAPPMAGPLARAPVAPAAPPRPAPSRPESKPALGAAVAPSPAMTTSPESTAPSTARAVALATPSAAAAPARAPVPATPAAARRAPAAKPERTPAARDRSATPASTNEPAREAADGSVTAIVIGPRDAADPGAPAAAYARVRVELEPGTTLSVDGERIGVAPIADLVIAPGLHTFVAELPGGVEIEQLIQVMPDTGVIEF